jgi:Fur family peroxide stress response transcriptional regulator
MIFAALAGRTDHPTAEQVFADVEARLPGMSRTTVYRVLETLVRLGVAAKVSHPGAAVRFDALTGRHHHLVCLRCNRLADLEDADLDALRLPDTRAHDFEILDYSVHLQGLCGSCRRGEKTRRNKST